jgi:hypothetical protein
VLAAFVNRNSRRWKTGIREGSNGYRDCVFPTVEAPVKRCTAARTEAKQDSVAFIANADILARLTLDLDVLVSKPCLRAKYAAGAPLTGKTVADGYPNWVLGNGYRKLTTTTRCDSSGHDGVSQLADA